MAKEHAIRIIRDESFKIPTDSVSDTFVKRVLKRFTYRFYNENACKKCEIFPDRHTETCDSCSAYKGSKATAKVVPADENPYGVEVLSVPRGAKGKLRAIFKERGVSKFKVERKPPKKTPFRRKIRLTRELRDYQVEAVDAIFEHRCGVIEAPPRSGKTLIATAAVAEIGFKTLILAQQREWLLQFQETFIGSDTQEGFTNARASQIGFIRSAKDLAKFDVCMATPQQFMSPTGRKRLEEIRNEFAVIVVDEVHGMPALQSARVLSRFNYIYLIGLSGTPDRKMGDYVVAEDLVGPVIYKAKVDRLRPSVEVVNPPGKYKVNGMGQAAMTYLVSKLENNTPRRNYLVKEIVKRAKAGHMVLVPMTRVNSILNYVRDINEEMGPKYALPFFGGLKKPQRVATIEAARNYKCKVLVGNIALLSTGLNIPRASCIFEMGINSNLPKAQQRFSRVLTPMEGKPNPLIVFTNDDCDLMRTCRRNEYWNLLHPQFNPRIAPEVQSELNSYFDKRNKSRHIDMRDLRQGI
jgi:superfamily II DNA or RNA helicase